jgi:acyl-CoA reductase-like NAD-dependent aldehyde dehydrogenase
MPFAVRFAKSFINGKWLESRCGRTEILYPWQKSSISMWNNSIEDVDSALRAAHGRKDAWAGISKDDRKFNI